MCTCLYYVLGMYVFFIMRVDIITDFKHIIFVSYADMNNILWYYLDAFKLYLKCGSFQAFKKKYVF